MKSIGQELLIKPNPANDIVEISLLNKEDGVCLIKINDLLGNILLTKSFNCEDKKVIVNTKSLAQGVYIVQVQKNNEWSKTEKLVINR